MRGAAELDIDPRLLGLLTQREAQIAHSNDCDIGELAHFLVIQPGETLDAIVAELGFSPLVNMVGQSNSWPNLRPSATTSRSASEIVGFFTTRSIPLA